MKNIMVRAALAGCFLLLSTAVDAGEKYEWRGLHFDEARHFFGKKTVKDYLVRMQKLKMNVFHWHLADDQGWRLDVPGFPELVKYGAVRTSTPIAGDDHKPLEQDGKRYGPYFYTPADVKEIVDFAAARGIRVVPEIEIPGHVRALLAAHPEFSCAGDLKREPWTNWGICDEVLCAGNDEAIAYYEKVLDAVMEMFPSEFIHIGGDECPKKAWKACPKCQARIRQLGLKDEDALQGWIMSRIVRHVAEKGRRAIAWDEILSCGDLPKGTVIQCWREFKYAAEAAKRGHDVIMSPYDWTYFTFAEGRPGDTYHYRGWTNGWKLPAAKMRAFDPAAGVPTELRSHILGAECCMWSEYVHNRKELDYKVLNRLAAFAEAMDRPKSKSWETYDAAPVTSVTVDGAKRSDPSGDENASQGRVAGKVLGVWEQTGKIPGKVLLEETFADMSWKKSWLVKGKTEWIDDGRGGKCHRIHPVKGMNSIVELRHEKRIPIDMRHPIGVLFEVRTPERHKPPFCRIDFFDKDGKQRGCYQFRSVTDVTQPQIFQRNGHLVKNIPDGTVSMTVMFPVGSLNPKRIEKPGDLANVRIVDLADDVADYLARSVARRERDMAAEDAVLVYSDDNLTASYPVMPAGDDVPGRSGATLALRECAGEKTRATAILWSKTKHDDVTVSFGDLTNESFGLGGKIPASSWSAKVVVSHYQGIGAPDTYLMKGEGQTLVPELLVNDDTLVVPDHRTHRNLVKYQLDGASWYVDINDVWTKWGERIPGDRMPIMDAKTLQPFTVMPRQNKQLALRVAVPADAAPGVYTGEIEFKSGGRTLAKLPVSLEVLPFALPKEPETIYDAKRKYTMGLYSWLRISPKDDGDWLAVNDRSRRQVLAEMKTLLDNGITSPALIWTADVVYDDAQFRRHLATAREAGLKGTLYLGASGLIGNATSPEELAALKKRIAKAKKVAREYGFNEVYFYGFDEAVGDRLVSQIPAWKAVREAGGKTVVSGYREHLEKVGPYLDLCIYADDPESAQVEKWHALGQRVWKYNTPQCGPEDPGLFRRNYGLGNWMSGFDGANTYSDWGYASGWNDLSCSVKLKQLGRMENASTLLARTICIVYATVDGVVETLALTGLESAIKDVRYMALFRRLLAARPDSDAKKWFDDLKPYEDDPASVRRETIDWILKLSK